MGINLERQKKSWTLNEVITNLSDTSTAQDFASSMEKIDNKLNEIKKEITYWDVYNISSAITSPEVFDSKIANLEINNSAVINTTYFKRNFQGIETEFHSGDVIIRLKDGSYQHIKAANAGVYVPDLQAFTQDQLKTYCENNENNKDEGIITYDEETKQYTWHSDKGYPKDKSGNDIYSNHLILTYNYATTAPLDGQEYQKFSTRIQSLSGDNSKMYGYSIPGTYNKQQPFPFPIIYSKQETVNGVQIPSFPIVPALKFFDKDNQEVYTDEYTLSSNGSNYSFYLHNNSSGLIQKVVIK